MPSKLPRPNSAKRERADRALALRSALAPLAVLILALRNGTALLKAPNVLQLDRQWHGS